jgi:hypothetical protein
MPCVRLGGAAAGAASAPATATAPEHWQATKHPRRDLVVYRGRSCTQAAAASSQDQRLPATMEDARLPVLRNHLGHQLCVAVTRTSL